MNHNKHIQLRALVASLTCPSVERDFIYFFLTFQVMTTLLLQAMYEPYLFNPLPTDLESCAILFIASYHTHMHFYVP